MIKWDVWDWWDSWDYWDGNSAGLWERSLLGFRNPTFAFRIPNSHILPYLPAGSSS